MKVLHISKAYPPVIGGIEVVLRDLAEGLAARGVDVDVLVCNSRMKTEIEERGHLRIIRTASPGKVASMHIGPTTPLHMLRLKRDITHIHIPYPMGEFSSLFASGGSKLVATWHSDIVRQQFLLRFYSPIVHRFLQRADEVYPTSLHLLDSSPFLSRVREKCHPIPLGIQPEDFSLTESRRTAAEEIKRQLGSFVLFIGRFVGYKAPLDLVEAMARVDAPVVFIGSGPLEEDMRRRADELGITARMHILRDVPDEVKIAHLHAASVFVLPSISRNEAFGLVLLEAMTCGLPLVTTDLPTGVAFVNQHEKTGLVVPKEDPPALAEAIDRLLGDTDLAQRLGEQGRKRIQQEFRVDQMVDAYLARYKLLLG